MDIFLYHLHGDTLFTAFLCSPTCRPGYHYTSINTKSTLTTAEPHTSHKILLSRNVSPTWGQRYNFAS